MMIPDIIAALEIKSVEWIGELVSSQRQHRFINHDQRDLGVLRGPSCGVAQFEVHRGLAARLKLFVAWRSRNRQLARRRRYRKVDRSRGESRSLRQLWIGLAIVVRS